MATQQEELNRRQAAMRHAKGAEGHAQDNSGKGVTRKQEKTQRWFDRISDQKAKRFNSGASGSKGQKQKGSW